MRVTRGHPPTFIWHTREDEIVPVAHAELYAQALENQGVPHSLLIFDEGLHGLGMSSPKSKSPVASTAPLVQRTVTGHDLDMNLIESETSDWAEQMIEWLGSWIEPQFCPPV